MPRAAHHPGTPILALLKGVQALTQAIIIHDIPEWKKISPVSFDMKLNLYPRWDL
jgi:hypothetical protein